MIRNLLAAAAALILTPALFAGTVQVPKESPIASFTFPEKWKVEVEDEGISVESPDEEIMLSVEAYDTKDISKAVEETLVGLKENKVTLDKASEKKSEASANGLDMVNYQWAGESEGVKCKICLSVLVGANKEKALVMLFWATPDGEKANGKDLQAIADSIKAAAK